MALDIGNFSSTGTAAQEIYERVWNDKKTENTWDPITVDILINGATHSVRAQRTSGGATPLQILSVDGQAYNASIHDALLNQPSSEARTGTIVGRALSSAFSAQAAEAVTAPSRVPASASTSSSTTFLSDRYLQGLVEFLGGDVKGVDGDRGKNTNAALEKILGSGSGNLSNREAIAQLEAQIAAMPKATVQQYLNELSAKGGRDSHYTIQAGLLARGVNDLNGNRPGVGFDGAVGPLTSAAANAAGYNVQNLLGASGPSGVTGPGGGVPAPGPGTSGPAPAPAPAPGPTPTPSPAPNAPQFGYESEFDTNGRQTKVTLVKNGQRLSGNGSDIELTALLDPNNHQTEINEFFDRLGTEGFGAGIIAAILKLFGLDAAQLQAVKSVYNGSDADVVAGLDQAIVGAGSAPGGPNPNPNPTQNQLKIVANAGGQPEALQITDQAGVPLKFGDQVTDVEIDVAVLKNPSDDPVIFRNFFEELEKSEISASDIKTSFGQLGLTPQELQIVLGGYVLNESPRSLDLDVANGLRSALFASQDFTLFTDDFINPTKIAAYQRDGSIAQDAGGKNIEIKITDFAGINPADPNDPETKNVIEFLQGVGGLSPMPGDQIAVMLQNAVLMNNPATPQDTQAMFDAIKEAYETHVPAANQDQDVKDALGIGGTVGPAGDPTIWDQAMSYAPGVAAGATPILLGALRDRQLNRSARQAEDQERQHVKALRDKIEPESIKAGAQAANAEKTAVESEHAGTREKRSFLEGLLGTSDARANALANRGGALTGADGRAQREAEAAHNADGTVNDAEQTRIQTETNDRVARVGEEAGRPGLIRRQTNAVTSGARGAGSWLVTNGTDLETHGNMFQRGIGWSARQTGRGLGLMPDAAAATAQRQARLQTTAETAAIDADMRVAQSAVEAVETERMRLEAEADNEEFDVNKKHPERGFGRRNRYALAATTLVAVLVAGGLAAAPANASELAEINPEAADLAQTGNYEAAGIALRQSAQGEIEELFTRLEKIAPELAGNIAQAMAAKAVGDSDAAADILREAGLGEDVVKALVDGRYEDLADLLAADAVGEEAAAAYADGRYMDAALAAGEHGLGFLAEVTGVQGIIDAAAAEETTMGAVAAGAGEAASVAGEYLTGATALVTTGIAFGLMSLDGHYDPNKPAEALGKYIVSKTQEFGGIPDDAPQAFIDMHGMFVKLVEMRAQMKALQSDDSVAPRVLRRAELALIAHKEKFHQYYSNISENGDVREVNGYLTELEMRQSEAWAREHQSPTSSRPAFTASVGSGVQLPDVEAFPAEYVLDNRVPAVSVVAADGSDGSAENDAYSAAWVQHPEEMRALVTDKIHDVMAGIQNPEMLADYKAALLDYYKEGRVGFMTREAEEITAVVGALESFSKTPAGVYSPLSDAKITAAPPKA